MRVPPILFLFLLLPALAHAQAGSLDPSFGSGGYVILSMGPQHDEILDATLQPDGRIVACGYRTDGDLNAHVFVGRYLPDGTPDASFGPEGPVEVDLGPDDARGTAIAVRPDGKIVVAGTYGSFSTSAFVMRLNADGSLDNSFGGTGKVITVVEGSLGSVYDLCLRPDGGVLVAGVLSTDGLSENLLLGYTSSGALDSGFGSGGRVTTSAGTAGGWLFAVQLQPDGRIVAAGNHRDTDGVREWVVMRFLADGTPDASFGDGGATYTSPSNGVYWESAAGLCLLPDGRIVLTGSSEPFLNVFYATLACYTATGQLDTSFGENGLLAFQAGQYATPNTAIVQPDGRLLFGGVSSSGYDNILFGRASTDGVLDPTFGTFGYTVTTVGGDGSTAHVMLLQADGGVLFLGGHNVSGFSDPFIARFFSGIVGMGIAEAPIGIDAFSLRPGPVPEQWTLRFQLPAAARVTAELLDPAGRPVQRLLSGKACGAGPQEAGFMLSTSLADGCYLVRLQAGGYVRTERLVLMH